MFSGSVGLYKHFFKQAKLADIQGSKKDLESKVEALRTIKETAEQPEKEAKERHLKAWEGILKLKYITIYCLCREHHIYRLYPSIVLFFY